MKASEAKLLEFIKKELRSRHLLEWPEDWCPVARMAVLAEKALLNNDPYLALAAFKEVARYTRAPLQAEPPPPNEDNGGIVDMSDIGRKFDELMGGRSVPAIEHFPGEVIEGEAIEVIETSNT